MLQDAQKVRPSSHGSPLAPSNTNKGDENDRSVRMGWEWDVPSWIRLGPVIIHLLRSRLARRRSVFDESGLREAKGASEVIARSDRRTTIDRYSECCACINYQHQNWLV